MEHGNIPTEFQLTETVEIIWFVVYVSQINQILICQLEPKDAVWFLASVFPGYQYEIKSS
jgi:hypothetical protein